MPGRVHRVQRGRGTGSPWSGAWASPGNCGPRLERRRARRSLLGELNIDGSNLNTIIDVDDKTNNDIMVSLFYQY